MSVQTYFDRTAKGELLARLTVDANRLSAAVADNLGQRGVRSVLEVRPFELRRARCSEAAVSCALVPHDHMSAASRHMISKPANVRLAI